MTEHRTRNALDLCSHCGRQTNGILCPPCMATYANYDGTDTDVDTRTDTRENNVHLSLNEYLQTNPTRIQLRDFVGEDMGNNAWAILSAWNSKR